MDQNTLSSMRNCSSQDDQQQQHHDEACPLKKMRCCEEREDDRNKNRSTEPNNSCPMSDISDEETTPVVKIKHSGLYALARAESDNANNNSQIDAPSCSGDFRIQTNGRDKIKKLRTYDNDTTCLPLFGEYLQNVSSPSNLSENRSLLPCSKPCNLSTLFSDVVAECSSETASSLPASLLVNIFRYLTMPELLCCASRVCKYWHQAALDPSLWRHIFLPVTSRVTDSILFWITSISDRVLTIDVSDSKHTSFSDEGIIRILQKCQHIRTLKLARYFVFSDDVFEAVGKHCHLVRHLNLDGCFSISDTSVIEIGKGCPNLEHLFMSQCNRISDDGMLAIAKGCPKLRQLRIDQCVKVKDVSIKALVASCPNLEYLHLLACCLTDDGLRDLVKLPLLRMLDISNMTQMSASVLEKIAVNCKKLEVLSVSLNRAVDDACVRTIVQSCSRLKCLSCVACNLTDKTLVHIGEYSKSLERVDVAWCAEITDYGVRSISESCKSLRYLGLMRCGQVTMETIDELIPIHPNIHYSNFVLESRKLLQIAHDQGQIESNY